MLEWLPLAYVLHLYVREHRRDTRARAMQPVAPAPSYTYAPTVYAPTVIVQILARARAAGVSVHAFGLSDHYRHIFEITRLSDFVALHADEAGAVA